MKYRSSRGRRSSRSKSRKKCSCCLVKTTRKTRSNRGSEKKKNSTLCSYCSRHNSYPCCKQLPHRLELEITTDKDHEAIYQGLSLSEDTRKHRDVYNLELSKLHDGTELNEPDEQHDERDSSQYIGTNTLFRQIVNRLPEKVVITLPCHIIREVARKLEENAEADDAPVELIIFSTDIHPLASTLMQKVTIPTGRPAARHLVSAESQTVDEYSRSSGHANKSFLSRRRARSSSGSFKSFDKFIHSVEPPRHRRRI